MSVSPTSGSQDRDASNVTGSKTSDRAGAWARAMGARGAGWNSKAPMSTTATQSPFPSSRRGAPFRSVAESVEESAPGVPASISGEPVLSR